jgi:hypothetical protein
VCRSSLLAQPGKLFGCHLTLAFHGFAIKWVQAVQHVLEHRWGFRLVIVALSTHSNTNMCCVHNRILMEKGLPPPDLTLVKGVVSLLALVNKLDIQGLWVGDIARVEDGWLLHSASPDNGSNVPRADPYKLLRYKV